MAPPRRSTRVCTSNAWVNGGMQPLGILTSSGDLITTSTLKRPQEDADNDTDYELDGQGHEKRSKTSRHGALVRRKSKVPKDGKVSAAFMFNSDIWMVILEHCTPAVLRKVCCLSKDFQALINKYQNLLVESRFQTYGLELQILPEGLSERQFSILLEGKGCMSCSNKRVTFTHWSWCKRWCTTCWEREVVTETSARQFLRDKQIMPTFEDQIISALPWGMRDSWRNPHPLLEEGERQYYKGAVKTFSKDELETMCEDFKALVPAIPIRRDGMTAPQHLAVITQWRQDLDAVPMRREAFFNQHIANANMIMEKALIIDKAVRAKGRKDKEIKQKNRDSRAQFFKDCAEVDLPDVPAECVKISRPFLAAIKIGTDGGSPRSWAILKPKIRKEWNALYEEGMKKAMWDHDKIQKAQKRMTELTIEEDYTVRKESLVEEETIVEQEPVEGEQAEGEPMEEDQAEEEQVENGDAIEPYSIWKDRDLACEFYKYSRSTAGKTGPAERIEDDSSGRVIESLYGGERVGTGDGFGTDNGFVTDGGSGTDDGCGADNGFGIDDVFGNDNGASNQQVDPSLESTVSEANPSIVASPCIPNS